MREMMVTKEGGSPPGIWVGETPTYKLKRTPTIRYQREPEKREGFGTWGKKLYFWRK
jgi:hypothetical protein